MIWHLVCWRTPVMWFAPATAYRDGYDRLWNIKKKEGISLVLKKKSKKVIRKKRVESTRAPVVEEQRATGVEEQCDEKHDVRGGKMRYRCVFPVSGHPLKGDDLLHHRDGQGSYWTTPIVPEVEPEVPEAEPEEPEDEEDDEEDNEEE